jgi:hypothetical protein
MFWNNLAKEYIFQYRGMERICIKTNTGNENLGERSSDKMGLNS